MKLFITDELINKTHDYVQKFQFRVHPNNIDRTASEHFHMHREQHTLGRNRLRCNRHAAEVKDLEALRKGSL